MSDNRLGQVMRAVTADITASENLQDKVSAAVHHRQRIRRTKGWLAVVGAGVAAAAVAVAIPLLRPAPVASPPAAPQPISPDGHAGSTSRAENSAGVGVVMSDPRSYLGSDKWYVTYMGDDSDVGYGIQDNRRPWLQVQNGMVQAYDGCHLWRGSAQFLVLATTTGQWNTTDHACIRDSGSSGLFTQALFIPSKTWEGGVGTNPSTLSLIAGVIHIEFSKSPHGVTSGQSTPPVSTASASGPAEPASSAEQLPQLSSGPSTAVENSAGIGVGMDDPRSYLGSEKWYVVEASQGGVVLDVARPATSTLPLERFPMWLRVKGNSIEAFDGCNYLGAAADQLESGVLTAPWSSTDVGCPSPPAAQQVFVDALHSSEKAWLGGVGINSDSLILDVGDRRITLTKHPDTAAPSSSATAKIVQDPRPVLGDRTWTVTRAANITGDVDVSAAATVPTLHISGAQVLVDDGCNDLAGSAAGLQSGVAIGSWSTTDAACSFTVSALFVQILSAKDKRWAVTDERTIEVASAKGTVWLTGS